MSQDTESLLQALNGILIVTLFMGWGVAVNDPMLIAAAFGMAGLSYLVNMGVRVLEMPTVGFGAAAYVYVVAKLLGGV